MSKLATLWGVVVKLLGVTSLVVVIIAAMFNLRLAFGAQVKDCLDHNVHITRLETPTTIDRGDLIVFVSPDKVGNPFAGHLFIKKVGAVPGDTIKVKDGVLYINGTQYGPLDIADKAAKQLGVSPSSFERTEVVPNGYLLALGTKPRSFDGRYWGLLPIDKVVGSAYPLY